MSLGEGLENEPSVNALRFLLGNRGFEVRVDREGDEYVVVAFHPVSGKRFSARSPSLHAAVGSVADQSGDDVRREWGD